MKMPLKNVSGRAAELKAEILFEGFAIELTFVGRMFEDGLYLGCEDELIVLDGIVKGLDAEIVSCAEEYVVRPIPYCEGEHAAKLFKGGLSPGNVSGEKNLRVGGGR